MKNLINNGIWPIRKPAFESAFEKKFGVPFDHFLEETPEGLAFNTEGFLHFTEHHGGDYRDFRDAVRFIRSERPETYDLFQKEIP